MKAKHRKLAREQLDATLKQFTALRKVPPPVKGWVRAIRDALGMTGEQLAKRLGVNKQRVARIEHDELSASVTLKTLRKTAQAMDCTFVYALVPNQSLEQTVRDQAKKVAKERMSRSDQMMRLEDQELSDKEKQMALNDLIEDIIISMPRKLWDEK